MVAEPNESRDRVLDVAERLFMENGYDAVKLKQIADALGIKQASLYYHFPEGKKSLFIETVRRSMERHRLGIENVIREAGNYWLDQLKAVAHWLLSQPPMDAMMLVKTNIPDVDPTTLTELTEVSYEALILPVSNILNNAQYRGEVFTIDTGLIAGSFVVMITSLHGLKEEWNPRPRLEMADELIRVFTEGLRPR